MLKINRYIPVNTNKNIIGLTLVISGEKTLKQKGLVETKRNFIMAKWSIHQEYLTILNFYDTNITRNV